jgi:alpha-ketoglutarate-dependent taurine dioxygenase
MNSEFEQELEYRLRKVFGDDARTEGPLSVSGAGRRFTGIDLRPRLNPDQVAFLLDALSHFGIVSIPGQDLETFSLTHFERFANHWGAPVPHPTNFLRGGKPSQSDGASDGPIEWIPFERRRAAAVNAAFPGELACLTHESPAVLVVANFRGKVENNLSIGTDEVYFPDKNRLVVQDKEKIAPVKVGAGGSWHTDIEYEPLPIYVSMFLVHRSPIARDEKFETWVAGPTQGDDDIRPYFEGSDPELYRLRKTLPLNGETAFADTTAALAALPASEQASLERVQVRRRLNEDDEGWLAPLVRTNPRSGVKSLHSPIWASRPCVRPAVEVDGMSCEESRYFLDQLEIHVLQPQFRYDHEHVPGDVTLWDNYMTLHNSPPIKSNITRLEDTRLLYRLSCKGEPALTLPRNDAPEWVDSHISGSYTSPKTIIEVG